LIQIPAQANYTDCKDEGSLLNISWFSVIIGIHRSYQPFTKLNFSFCILHLTFYTYCTAGLLFAADTRINIPTIAKFTNVDEPP